MNEFEKWFENYVSKVEDKWTKLLIQNMKKLYEFVWKEALEHAINKLKTDVNGFFELTKELESLSQQSNNQP